MCLEQANFVLAFFLFPSVALRLLQSRICTAGYEGYAVVKVP